MKYFEIPATGTLLFAEKTELYEAMGFVDGIHYVAVTPEDFREKITLYLSKNYNDVVEKIIENATDFIMKHHTHHHHLRHHLLSFHFNNRLKIKTLVKHKILESSFYNNV